MQTFNFSPMNIAKFVGICAIAHILLFADGYQARGFPEVASGSELSLPAPDISYSPPLAGGYALPSSAGPSNRNANNLMDMGEVDDEDDDDDAQAPQTQAQNPSALSTAQSQLDGSQNLSPSAYKLVGAASNDLKTSASHHKHHGHGVKGWLDMGAWTGKKGAFGWYDKHPVGKKGRK